MKVFGNVEGIKNAGNTFLAILMSLLKIKSLVTLTLTAVFAYMLVTQMDIPKYFETVYTVIVSFFFGTIYEKGRNVNDGIHE